MESGEPGLNKEIVQSKNNFKLNLHKEGFNSINLNEEIKVITILHRTVQFF